METGEVTSPARAVRRDLVPLPPLLFGLLFPKNPGHDRGTWSSARRRGAPFRGAGGVAPVVEIVFSRRMLPFALAAAILNQRVFNVYEEVMAAPLRPPSARTTLVVSLGA